MKKNFGLLGLIYLIGQVLTKMISFVLIPLYTKKLGVEMYGQLSIVDTILGFVSSFLILSIYSGYIRFHHKFKKNLTELRSTALIFSLLLSFIEFLLFLIIGKKLSTYLQLDNSYLILIFILLRGLSEQYILLLSSDYVLEYNAKKSVNINILTLVFNLIFVLYFVLLKSEGIVGIYKGYFLGNIPTLLYLIIDNHKKYKLIINKRLLKKMLKFSTGYLPGNVGDLVLSMSDRYFLVFYSSFGVTGIYSLGYKFGMLVVPIFLQPFAKIFTPYKFEIIEKTKEKVAKEKIKLAFKIYNLLGSIVVLLLGVNVKLIIYYSTTKEFFNSYKIVFLIAISYLIYGQREFFKIGIQNKNKTYLESLILVAGGILNILLNYILIPKLGMYGAAISTIISYLIMNFIYLIFSFYLYRIDFNLIYTIKLYLSIVIVYLIYYLLTLLNLNIWIESIIGNILIVGFIIIIYKFYILKQEQKWVDEKLKNQLEKIRRIK